MKTALIVIDMQRGFIDPRSAQCISGAAATVPDCARVIRHCRNNGIPVIFVTRLYRADGSDVEHTRFKRYSAFFATELDMLLRRLRVDTVVLAGTTTPNCIRTTCYDAISLDYNTVVLSDCTSSASEEIQLSNLRDMANVGAQILSAGEFISGCEISDSAGWAKDSVGK